MYCDHHFMTNDETYVNFMIKPKERRKCYRFWFSVDELLFNCFWIKCRNQQRLMTEIKYLSTVRNKKVARVQTCQFLKNVNTSKSMALLLKVLRCQEIWKIFGVFNSINAAVVTASYVVTEAVELTNENKLFCQQTN